MTTVDGHSAPGGSPRSALADPELASILIPLGHADRPSFVVKSFRHE